MGLGKEMNKLGGRATVSEEIGHPRLGLGSRPVVGGAFALSAAIHIIGILVYPYLFPSIQPDGVVFSYPAESAETGGIEVLRIVEVDVLQDLETLKIQKKLKQSRPRQRFRNRIFVILLPSSLCGQA